MIRAYDKTYLEDAMLNLAVALDYGSIACAGGIDEFYDRMLAGNVIRQFEKGNPKYVSGLSGIELGKKIIESTGGRARDYNYVLDDRSAIFWTGWVLAYLQWHTNLPFESLNAKGIDVHRVMDMYPTFHEADISKFVASALKIMSNSETDVSPLKRQRKSAGFTQQELAERSGVSLRMIRAYEQNKQDISKAESAAVLNLASVLGCSPYFLLRWRDAATPHSVTY